MKSVAKTPGGERVLIAAEDRDYVAAARDAGFEERQWRTLFYDNGVHDSSSPTPQMKRLVEIILERFSNEPSKAPT
jgi:hypothetical protein